MEVIWTVRDIAERYKCSQQCARNYVRKMPHLERPLGVYESDLLAWETGRMVVPAGAKTTSKKLVVSRKR